MLLDTDGFYPSRRGSKARGRRREVELACTFGHLFREEERSKSGCLAFSTLRFVCNNRGLSLDTQISLITVIGEEESELVAKG